MHSLAMAKNILQAALAEAERHEGKQIKTICVRLGSHDFAEADSLQFCLEAMTKGTIAEDAQVEIELVNSTAMSTGEDTSSVTLELN